MKFTYAKFTYALLTTLLTSAVSASCATAAPRPEDYSQGIAVTTYEGRPLVEALLPDSVYQNVTRPDLGDVRVFNADGIAVPHAFCASATAVEPVVGQENLPVFDLQAPTANGDGGGTRVEVATAGGTQVRIHEGNATEASGSGTQTWAHVIDARAVTDELRSIEFDWRSPDGASQASVRVEASNDLDQWQSVVNASTLLRVTHESQQLQRKVIPMPQRRYEYLRIVRTDGGPPLQITAVIAGRVSQPEAIEPVWFTANPLTSPSSSELLFDAQRLAPIGYARLVLSQENSAVRVTLQSRADQQAPWHARWAGEFYSISQQGQKRVSPPAQINGEHDRYWRVTYATASEALMPAPALELGYRPARLRFLAQGAGPFTLAFGSHRAEAAPIQPCASLLSDVSGQDLQQLIGEGSLAALQTLGGELALKPLPKKTPVRLVVLWGVLIIGVGLVGAMAISLLKRVR